MLTLTLSLVNNNIKQLTAQMRAALGLTGGSSIENVMIFQQQQRQQELQREAQLRQMLLQEQLAEQHGGLGFSSILHQNQLRSMGNAVRLGDYPDLQEHYQNLLLNEQMQQQNEERAILEAQAQLRYHEELRLQRMQQIQQESQPASRAEEFSTKAPSAATAAESVPSAAMLRDLAADSLAGNAMMKPGAEIKKKRTANETNGVMNGASKDAPADGRAGSKPKKRTAKVQQEKTKTKKSKTKKSPKTKTKSPVTLLASTGSNAAKTTSPHLQLPQDEAKKNTIGTPSIVPKPMQQQFHDSPLFTPQSFHTSGPVPGSAVSHNESHASQSSPLLNPVILDAAMSRHAGYAPSLPQSPRFGTVESLIVAADTESREEKVLYTLRCLKSQPCEEIDDEGEPEATLPMPNEPTLPTLKKGEYIKLSDGFESELPLLPQEPLYDGPEASYENDDVPDDRQNVSLQHVPSLDSSDGKALDKVGDNKATARTVSNVLECPYPIDVWWPSNSSIRKERRMAGEESDEDDFEDDRSFAKKSPTLRANLPEIKRRLERELKPGVLQKLPHCKLHRLMMRKKKNLPVPDLVYCWQVSDIYPNDTLVCCSKCGTWRHTVCGGHHAPYSKRDNARVPFVAVCDHCHVEEKILQGYPNARVRLERQQMEQIRRGLATTAVMRAASLAKHGGTYKWPLGRVNAAHMANHVRSVHSRHDKAEKQWSEMVTRLADDYSHRPRERTRVRTKELERLLVSVEDAGKMIDCKCSA